MIVLPGLSSGQQYKALIRKSEIMSSESRSPDLGGQAIQRELTVAGDWFATNFPEITAIRKPHTLLHAHINIT